MYAFAATDIVHIDIFKGDKKMRVYFNILLKQEFVSRIIVSIDCGKTEIS